MCIYIFTVEIVFKWKSTFSFLCFLLWTLWVKVGVVVELEDQVGVSLVHMFLPMTRNLRDRNMGCIFYQVELQDSYIHVDEDIHGQTEHMKSRAHRPCHNNRYPFQTFCLLTTLNVPNHHHRCFPPCSLFLKRNSYDGDVMEVGTGCWNLFHCQNQKILNPVPRVSPVTIDQKCHITHTYIIVCIGR